MQTCRNSRKSLSIFPVPSTTEASGSSAIETGKPVSSRILLSRFFSSAPPPVKTMPRSLISAESSGGVRSSATRIAFRIVATHSPSDSRISLSSMVTVRGTPSIKLRPFTSMVSGFSSGYAEPISILICSAVRSPTRRLYLRFKYCITASSISLPATRTGRERARFIWWSRRRLLDRQSRANRCRHRLLHQIHLARSRPVRGVLHRPLFHRRNLARHANHNPRVHQHAPVVRLLNKVRQHLFRDFEVRNHAVFHRLDGHHVSRRAPQHVFGFTPHRHHFTARLVNRHDRRLVHHDAFAVREHQRVRRAQVDRQVGRKQAEHRPQVVTVLIHSSTPRGDSCRSAARSPYCLRT